MTKHGGKRKGAGRPQGKVSEAKRQIAQMLEEHVPDAIETLASAAKDGDVMAARDILDRVYGKPRQSLEHSSKPDFAITGIEYTIVDPKDFETDEGNRNAST